MTTKASRPGPACFDAQSTVEDIRAETREEIRESAIRWLLWLRSGNAGEADFKAFRKWRTQNAEHARAAHEVAWVWRMLGLLARKERSARDERSSRTYSHPPADEKPRVCSRSPREGRVRSY
ncbi:FecR/PupR family sigma factor regulator [Paraburkholderia megapolitana]|uniref:FecR N-terminal domain-containing protein n=1 Tax=Paraburkholderia megapolitana TaxID=420953 RepID=A0A1I3DF93_9BURK|nr:DUF4880 domain-containing protein [Paraburkholderia megapolitana]QDQ81815.1 DUF4880 domain-containing protein [Paraburkholderia megapolitana]SFH85404.1 protein of unknown function [Paraburkholderia megapolitana]